MCDKAETRYARAFILVPRAVFLEAGVLLSFFSARARRKDIARDFPDEGGRGLLIRVVFSGVVSFGSGERERFWVCFNWGLRWVVRLFKVESSL